MKKKCFLFLFLFCIQNIRAEVVLYSRPSTPMCADMTLNQQNDEQMKMREQFAIQTLHLLKDIPINAVNIDGIIVDEDKQLSVHRNNCADYLDLKYQYFKFLLEARKDPKQTKLVDFILISEINRVLKELYPVRKYKVFGSPLNDLIDQHIDKAQSNYLEIKQLFQMQ